MALDGRDGVVAVRGGSCVWAAGGAGGECAVVVAHGGMREVGL